MVGGCGSLVVTSSRSSRPLAGSRSEEVDEGTGEVTDQSTQQWPSLSPGPELGGPGLAGEDGGQQDQADQTDRQLLHLNHGVGRDFVG